MATEIEDGLVQDSIVEKSRIKDSKIQIILRALILSIGGFMVLTIGLAWWQYPEPYEFFAEAISNLGGILSDNSFINNTSLIIMRIGFAISGAIALACAIIYLLNRGLKFAIGKAILCLALMLGMIGIAIPYDHSTLNLLHYIGALFFVLGFGILNFVWQALRFVRRYNKQRSKPRLKSLNFLLDMIMVVLVFVTIVVYAIIFPLSNQAILSMATAALIQKIVLIVDVFAIINLDTNDM